MFVTIDDLRNTLNILITIFVNKSIQSEEKRRAIIRHVITITIMISMILSSIILITIFVYKSTKSEEKSDHWTKDEKCFAILHNIYYDYSYVCLVSCCRLLKKVLEPSIPLGSILSQIMLNKKPV